MKVQVSHLHQFLLVLYQPHLLVESEDTLWRLLLFKTKELGRSKPLKVAGSTKGWMFDSKFGCIKGRALKADRLSKSAWPVDCNSLTNNIYRNRSFRYLFLVFWKKRVPVTSSRELVTFNTIVIVVDLYGASCDFEPYVLANICPICVYLWSTIYNQLLQQIYHFFNSNIGSHNRFLSACVFYSSFNSSKVCIIQAAFLASYCGNGVHTARKLINLNRL
jgi:hypothetical protein